jgi:hypothetical protein
MECSQIPGYALRTLTIVGLLPSLSGRLIILLVPAIPGRFHNIACLNLAWPRGWIYLSFHEERP